MRHARHLRGDGVTGFGGIARQAHFAFVQTLDLALFADPIADEHVDDLEPNVRSETDPHDVDDNADDRRHELPAVAVEQAFHVARDAIEPVALGPVGKQTETNDAHQGHHATRHVHDGATRKVHMAVTETVILAE